MNVVNESAFDIQKIEAILFLLCKSMKKERIIRMRLLTLRGFRFVLYLHPNVFNNNV